MSVRYVLLFLLIVFLSRALWRFLDGLIEGLSGTSGGRTGVPERGVHMVRDPVCGTFVVPDRAVTLVDGSRRVHFCSVTCRDQYRARTA